MALNLKFVHRLKSTEWIHIPLCRLVSTQIFRTEQLSPCNNFKVFPSGSNLFTTFSDASDLYSSLLKQCIDRKSIKSIKKIHAHMIASGFPLLVSCSKLVDACLKCGNISYAGKVFDGIPVRHIVTWNSIIASYISQKRNEKAIKLYDRMVLEGVFPDEYTFSSIFKAFSELSLKLEGRKAHGLALVLGLEVSNRFVASALVDMYAKLGKMRDAQLVFDKVQEKDVVLFTALIVGFSQHGEDGEALKAFGRMIIEGVKGNEYTFASILISCANLEDISYGKLIHGLTIKTGFESAVASQTSLLTMYSKCGLIDNSLQVFKVLNNPNQVTWTSLIVALTQNGREETALTKFRKMMRDSINPNSFTLSSVLRACSSLAMLESGKQVHGIVIKHGLDRDRYAGAALIDLYGKCGSTTLSRMVFDCLNELDIISVNSMMYSYALNGYGHETLELFNKMKDMGLEPNNVTIVSVLTACNNAGLIEEGCRLFEVIRHKHKIELTREHYTCMVDLLGRSGRFVEAENLIQNVKNPDVILWRTLLSACRTHGEVEMAERMKCRVMELAPRDEGTHVLLSNLYASTGKWSKVTEMKSRMRDMKLRKNPAMSWVDVDNEVHTFMAGDWSHARSREICGTLEELTEKARGLGYVADTRFVLQNMDEEMKEKSLYYHSERLAIAFAVWKSGDKSSSSSIRILKNLRVCGDCHSWIKFVSKVVGREIIARDAKRFHHFKDGLCSCRDYW